VSVVERKMAAQRSARSSLQHGKHGKHGKHLSVKSVLVSQARRPLNARRGAEVQGELQRRLDFGGSTSHMRARAWR
jgi:hypothetical protein